MNENIKFPYDDAYLKYNYMRHRYELTEQAVFEELGLNFKEFSDMETLDANPSTMGNRALKEVSTILYTYLLEDTMNPDWLRYELATVPELRSVIMEMLLAQAGYMLDNGNIATFSGLDIYNGKAMERYKIKEAIIAPSVVAMAERIQPSLGRSLKYAGCFGGCAPRFNNPDGTPRY